MPSCAGNNPMALKQNQHTSSPNQNLSEYDHLLLKLDSFCVDRLDNVCTDSFHIDHWENVCTCTISCIEQIQQYVSPENKTVMDGFNWLLKKKDTRSIIMACHKKRSLFKATLHLTGRNTTRFKLTLANVHANCKWIVHFQTMDKRIIPLVDSANNSLQSSITFANQKLSAPTMKNI